MTLLIKKAQTVDGAKADILVEGNLIMKVGRAGDKSGLVIDGSGLMALPGLINMHTHSPMTLFRGFADDMEFHEAWPKKIWPAESRLTASDILAGAKLACLEMIKSGTTCFNDQYFFPDGSIARAAKETGLRAVVGWDTKDVPAGELSESRVKSVLDDIRRQGGSRITAALAPHSIYAVEKEHLAWVKDYADKNGLLLHFHLSETRKENEDCVKKHGKRPVELLEELGFLGGNLIAAHCVWLTKGEIKTLARHKVTVVHNPTSNMKLATGGVMPYQEMKKAGVSVTLGTDSCASNNNLDMFECMKFAALLQKSHIWDQTVLPAGEALEMATAKAAAALRLNAGALREGMLADIILVDLRRPELTPNTNVASNLVYSASGGCVDTAVCDGQILMRGRVVEGEEKILEEAGETAEKLMASTK